MNVFEKTIVILSKQGIWMFGNFYRRQLLSSSNS